MKRIRLGALCLCALFLILSCVSSPKPGKNGDSGSQPAAQEESAAKKRAKELVTGKPEGSGADVAANAQGGADKVPADAAKAPVDTVDASDLPAEPTADEIKFLESYLASLKYMVYYDEGAGISPQLAKTAIAQANRYLIEKMGVQPVDLDTVEKKKADERAAYQSETGNSIDYIQFIAQKLNADIYLEIAFGVQNETANGKYYSTATGSMKIYNASTGDLLGSIAMNSPKTVWSTQDGATANAITASVWMAMPKMADQSKALLKSAWKDGIRYEMVIQNTPDAKKVSQLKRQLLKKVRKIQQDSYSAQETRWSVYTFKKSDTIEDAVYDAAEMVGLRDINLVYSRGKSFVFNSGLD
jgi:hypothetical protein